MADLFTGTAPAPPAIVAIVPGRPVAWARANDRRDPATGRRLAGRVNTAAHNERLSIIRGYLRRAMDARQIKAPLTGPVLLSTIAVFRRPKRLKGTAREWMPHDPDLDNLVKMAADAARGIVVRDDCQIVSLGRTMTVYGRPGEHEHVRITARDLTGVPVPDFPMFEVQ